MKNRKKGSFFLMLLCMALICTPVQADTHSTIFTAMVPEQPPDTIKAPEGAETLGEIPLPKGWVWKNPDRPLAPGSEFTATALYRDEDGKVLAERTVIIHIPKTPKPTVTPDTDKEKDPSPNVPDKKPGAALHQETDSADSAPVKTGDETNTALWLTAAALAAGVLVIVGIRLKRKKK